MQLPHLAKLSPTYAANLARKDKLTNQLAETEAHALRLQRLMNSGTDPYREERIKALVEGTTLDGAQSVKTEYESSCTACADILTALHTVERDLSASTHEAHRAFCKAIQPDHDRLMIALTKNLAAAHADWLALSNLRRDMAAQSIGLYGVFDAVPEFMGSATDRNGDFAAFMREAQELGYGTAPKELQ